MIYRKTHMRAMPASCAGCADYLDCPLPGPADGELFAACVHARHPDCPLVELACPLLAAWEGVSGAE